MLDFMQYVPKIPIAEGVTWLTEKTTEVFSFLFNPIKTHFGDFMDSVTDLLLAIPPIIFILIIALLAFYISGKRFGLAAFSVIGLLIIYNQ